MGASLDPGGKSLSLYSSYGIPKLSCSEMIARSYLTRCPLLLIIKLWIKYRFNNKKESAVLSKRASMTNLSSLASPMVRVQLKMGSWEGKIQDLVSPAYLMCVDSFRRFLVDFGSIYNPEYNIDISHGLPKIADYGNIQILPQPGQSKTPS